MSKVQTQHLRQFGGAEKAAGRREGQALATHRIDCGADLGPVLSQIALNAKMAPKCPQITERKEPLATG